MAHVVSYSTRIILTSTCLGDVDVKNDCWTANFSVGIWCISRTEGVVLYSASDLVNYLECERLTSLDLIDLETPLPRTADSYEAKLIQAAYVRFAVMHVRTATVQIRPDVSCRKDDISWSGATRLSCQLS